MAHFATIKNIGMHYLVLTTFPPPPEWRKKKQTHSGQNRMKEIFLEDDLQFIAKSF